MKAVRKTKAGPGFELVEVPIPEPKEGEVLIKILACSLCGTDVHVHDWDNPFCNGRLKPPVTTGHEVCGEVVKIGLSTNNSIKKSYFETEKDENANVLKIGDLVSAESHIPCASQFINKQKEEEIENKEKVLEECEMCKMGNYHICQKVKFFSVDVNGFLAQYAVAPANILQKNPSDMKQEIASLQESLGNSVYVVDESNVKGKDVAVFGLGPTGLNTIAVSKQLGAKHIFAVGGTKQHLNLAKQMGATHLIDRHNCDVVSELKKLTNDRGPHVVLEMSGSSKALEQALDCVMTTGMITILGLYSKPFEIDVSNKIVLKDICVRGIYGRKIWQTWKLTQKLLEEGLDISPVITHKYVGLEQFEEAIKAMKSGACGKCVFFPHGLPTN